MDKFTEKAKLLNDEDLIIRIGNLGRGDDYDGNFTNTGLNEFRAYQNVAIDRLDELRKEIATLTEQLRLANEDAERLAEYVGHKRTCTWAVVRSDVTPKCDCGLSDALHLHEERIAQER